MHDGVDTNLIVNESVLLTEGEINDICVIFAYNEKGRERDIQVQVFILPQSNTSCMYTWLITSCIP